MLPTFEDVCRAAKVLEGRVVRTAVVRSEALDAIAGCELWLKCESMQLVGAFKARGALYAVSRLAPAARARGVITYSSGNHAQALALAARHYEVPAAVAMPEDAPAVKVAAVRALGAEVVFAGFTSEDRRRAALEIQARTGGAMVPPFDHPDIVAGQGTATLELFEQAGELDALLVPVGGGGLCAGACLVAEQHGTRVFSVEPEGCDAMAQSIERGERAVVEPRATIADGLKPVQVGEIPFAIARRVLAGALRVDDDAIARALVSVLLYARVLTEPSGATALAAALRGGLPGSPRRVGVILSGGNIGAADLARLLGRYEPYTRR
jgi:threo-3-hydroxy-L-aspartate ammonia-lyase